MFQVSINVLMSKGFSSMTWKCNLYLYVKLVVFGVGSISISIQISLILFVTFYGKVVLQRDVCTIF